MLTKDFVVARLAVIVAAILRSEDSLNMLQLVIDADDFLAAKVAFYQLMWGEAFTVDELRAKSNYPDLHATQLDFEQHQVELEQFLAHLIAETEPSLALPKREAISVADDVRDREAELLEIPTTDSDATGTSLIS